jgi:molybdate transport system ATP-binding protein
MPIFTVDIERSFARGPKIQARLELPTDSFSVTALIGPSGCGKTTILRCLAGLDQPSSGRIASGGDIWCDRASGICLTPQQRGIGYLVQEYALFPHLTVQGNIAFGLVRSARPEVQKRVGELMGLMQLRGMEMRYPHELSGGQQQRVALARTVAPRPQLLLLDEPLSALDAPTRAELRQEMRQLLARWRIPAIVVTHDPLEVAALADQVVVMCAGQVRQSGAVADVLKNPVDAEVARIVSCA